MTNFTYQKVRIMDNSTLKKVVITGAGSGIGLALAEEFYRHGYKIMCIDKAWSVQHRDENIVRITADVSEDVFWRNTFPNLITSFQPNILINNAGIQFECSFLETTPEIFDKTWRTNLVAPLFLSQAAVKFWIENEISGLIINLSSIHETIPSGIPSYSTSKAALGMLTKEIALAVASHGVRAFCIAPGSVDTPLNVKDLDTPEKRKIAENSIPVGRLCEASEVARLIYILAENCFYLTGTTIVLDGGLSIS
jgi:glucose 1-dehydrogenase